MQAQVRKSGRRKALAAKTRENLLSWHGRTNVECLFENLAEFLGTTNHSFTGNFPVTRLNDEAVIDQLVASVASEALQDERAHKGYFRTRRGVPIGKFVV